MTCLLGSQTWKTPVPYSPLLYKAGNSMISIFRGNEEEGPLELAQGVFPMSGERSQSIQRVHKPLEISMAHDLCPGEKVQRGRLL